MIDLSRPSLFSASGMQAAQETVRVGSASSVILLANQETVTQGAGVLSVGVGEDAFALSPQPNL